MKPPGLAVRPAARVGPVFRSWNCLRAPSVGGTSREAPFFCRRLQTWVVCNLLRSKSFIVHKLGCVRVKSCLLNGLNPLNRFYQ